MMTPRAFERSIQVSFNSLKDIGMTDWGKFPRKGSLSPDPNFNRVALSATSTYELVFKAALGLNYFNFSLLDHALFQFSIRSTRTGYILRYAYYPNPFMIDSETREMITEVLIEEPDMIDQVLDEVPIYIDKPPIRYDFDVDCHRPCEHPAGHLHVGAHSSSRWPVKRILTPEAFSLFIAKHYYPSEWSQYGLDSGEAGGFSNTLDHRYANAASECELIGSPHFTEQEEKHFYIS